MNRFGGGPRVTGYSSYPRYSGGAVHSDSEDSSTHSVRVSRLIEKIKSQQKEGRGASRGYVPPSDGFNYFGSSNNDLIYSRVERGKDERKGTVRERFVARERTPLHKTTVLINEDSGGDTSGDYYGGGRRNDNSGLYSSRYTSGFGGGRYFGEMTDYEDDRRMSRIERENQYASRSDDRKFGTLRSNARNSVPKIILHEEAVAEIPNGRVGSTRSPSRDVTTDDEFNERGNGKGSRFLGGFLTLKRGKKDSGRSVTRSPSAQTRTPSYLTVPGSTKHDAGNDSSSSPKYYVPYHRSTPTLYESKFERDRMSSTGGSVLSNGSYVNKHVSRSMSMKAPWEPKHRTNEIDYYEEPYKPEPKRTNLSRSKSMPGKKLTSIIGNWVSKGTLKRQSDKQDKEEDERLLAKKQQPGKWGTLLRFGKGKKVQEAPPPPRNLSPERPARVKKHPEGNYRSGSSPVRGGTLLRNSYEQRGERSSTLLRNSGGFKRGGNSGGGGQGGSRGFY